MKELKKEISEKLKQIEKLIESNCNKEEIEKERKIVDEMLEKYIKQL